MLYNYPLHFIIKQFRYRTWRYWTLQGYFGGWVFPYISRIHTASIGFRIPPFLGTNEMFGDYIPIIFLDVLQCTHRISSDHFHPDPFEMRLTDWSIETISETSQDWRWNHSELEHFLCGRREPNDGEEKHPFWRNKIVLGGERPTKDGSILMPTIW